MPLSTELMSKYLVWRPSGKWYCCFSNNPSLLKQIHWFPLERQTASTLELWYYIFEFKSVDNNGSFVPLHIHTHTVIKRILSLKFQKPICTKTEWTVVNCRVSRSGVVCHRCHSLHQQQQHPGTLFCCCGNTDDYPTLLKH